MNQRRAHKTLVSFTLLLLITGIFAPTAYANSAEPPGLTVVVPFPPEDLTVSIYFADGNRINAIQLQKEQKAWEAYYRFFHGMVASTRPSLEGAILVVQSGEKTFEYPLPESTFSQYNNLLTLDVVNESVTLGQPLMRSVLLISMRVVLTLLIEGLVFFAFGYRQKESWTAFVAINLLTQGMLNIALSGPDSGSYWMFAYIFYEILIFIAEMTAFAFILREKKKGRAIACAFTANAASLILGGMLISYLPV